MMEEAFRLIDDPAGESTYLRLSTRSIQQVERTDDSWREGALARRLLAARARPGRRSRDRRHGRGHARGARRLGGAAARTCPASACSPSPRPTCSTAAGPPRRPRAGRASASRATSSSCCRSSAPNAGLVTLADAAPASLSWLGGVLGQRVAPLGVEKFGQTGNLADLYAAYRLDGAAITEAVAELLLPA